ncbi:MAG: RNA-binding cell elongation regulator Jag/EloR [Thermoleophilia bacterium]
MSGDPQAQVEAEATGETVGEAKWAALRELERRVPGLDRNAVEFQVISEGERGLLGVGFIEARVIARVAGGPPPERTIAAGRPAAPAATHATGSPAAVLAETLERICDGIGVSARVSVTEDEGALRASLAGPDVGLLIGKHGQTIDAIQHLAGAVVAHAAGTRLDVVVDAGGYRERRRATLEGMAERAAARVRASGSPVALDPMTASERKIVHLRLRELGLDSVSEGHEPSRYVVVQPPA